MEAPPMKRARHKYGAVRTTANGRVYASKAEARYATMLGREQAAGVVVGWIEQVPFRLPCGTKYVADFLIFYADGSAILVDVKGVETAAFKIKQRMMAAHFPWIPLVVVPAKSVP